MSPSRADGRFQGEGVGEHLQPTPRIHRLIPIAAAFVAVLAASAGALVLVRHQGVGIGGDEPYYLIEAVSIGRFHTINLNPGYGFAVAHHVIFPWHAHLGPHLAAQIGQGRPIVKNGLVLPTHAIGLSALLAIPMLAGTHVAVAASIVMLAALAIGLAHIVGEVADIKSEWRVATAGLVLAPTYVLASTQLYPDLISGLVIAVIVMLFALIERRSGTTGIQVAVVASLLTVLPWLDAKNILLTPVLMVGVLLVYLRTRLSTNQLGWLLIPPIVGLACLVAFNLWGFGYPFGARQPINLFGVNTATRFIALLFDRRQGLMVQFPIVLLGLAGIWISRRRNPIAALTATAMVLLIAYGNATQVISFGGGSFVGRFEWPPVPVLLAFAGLYLLELWKVRPRAVVAIGSLVGVLYVLQAIPVLLDRHQYFNQLAWDPNRYSGWWPVGGFDPSPVLGYLGSVAHWPVSVSDVLGVSSDMATSIVGTIPGIHWWLSERTWIGLVWLVVSGATVVCVLVAVQRRDVRRSQKTLGALLGLSVITGAVALATPTLLPPTATFNASSYISTAPIRGTSRVLTGPAAPPVLGPYWALLPGSYTAKVNYRLLSGSGNATVSVVAITEQSPMGRVVVQPTSLPTSSNSVGISFTIPAPEKVAVRVLLTGAGSLEMRAMTLAKNGSK